MNWLSDEVISRLQAASALPDLSGTRYRLVKRAGSGGMGVVYLAEDTILGRHVALKVLDLPDTSGELAVRLLREASILATLEHPGIVPVHDAGTLADGRAFYAMKFVEGTRLDHLDAQKETLFDRLRIFMRICETVSFAHARGVLHRDLTPGNIMIGSFGEVLVMDWGVAKILRSPSKRAVDSLPNQTTTAGNDALPAAVSQTAYGTVLGTVGYMSPEQARGEIDSLDLRSDIFSLGAILQFLFTQLSSETQSPPLSAIAKKAMSPDRAHRYESCRALGQDIGQYLDGLPVSAYPETIFTKMSRWGSKYRVAIVLVLTYLLVRTLLLLGYRH
jgi:eukaryotic-like serine/threonine-protein kinase